MAAYLHPRQRHTFSRSWCTGSIQLTRYDPRLLVPIGFEANSIDRRSCNMPSPAYHSSFGHLQNTRFIVVFGELVVHSSPSHIVFLHAAEDRSKYSAFEIPKSLKVLLKHNLRLILLVANKTICTW